MITFYPKAGTSGEENRNVRDARWEFTYNSISNGYYKANVGNLSGISSLTISSTDYDDEYQYELIVGIYESGDQYYNVELWTENNKRGYYRVISVNASDGNGQLSVAYLEGDDDYTLLEGEQTQIYFGSISGVNQFKMLKDVSLTNPLTDAKIMI